MLDTESVYLGIEPYFNTLAGPFVIIRKQKIHGCIEIKLLSKKHKDFRSNSSCVTTPGHAHVNARSVEQCPKVTNITDLIKAVLND